MWKKLFDSAHRLFSQLRNKAQSLGKWLWLSRFLFGAISFLAAVITISEILWR